jgi:hypothetical protein
MPTINIVKTVSNLASVTGLSFTATAVQSNVNYPLTATYSAPNLTLTSSGNIGVSGNFTFNVTANYTAFGTSCSDNITFTEQVVNNFTNLIWYGNFLNGNAFDERLNNNQGANVQYQSLIYNTDLNHLFLLKAGSGESIFEFYYANPIGISHCLGGTSLVFSNDFNKGFGITNGGKCGVAGYVLQVKADGAQDYLYYMNYGSASCGGNDFVSNGVHYVLDYIDSTQIPSTIYPKTKFKMRMLNGIYELYKNDVLVGSLSYDNTVDYYIIATQLNAYDGNTGSSIQLLNVSGNFV